MDDKKKHKDNATATGEEDHVLWEAAIKDVKPLRGRKPKKDLEKPNKTGACFSTAQPGKTSVKPGKRHIKGPNHSDTPSVSKNSPPSNHIDRRTEMRLKRGQMQIEARLDLHGMRQETARIAITRFLSDCHLQQKRCVLIVTGKGYIEGPKDTGRSGLRPGVLKRKLPVWLEESPLNGFVLQHAQALPKDGGSGAYYILLRRKR